MSHRLLELDAPRLARWVEGFGERHGAVVVSREDDGVHLMAADGSVAVLEPPFGLEPAGSTVHDDPVGEVGLRAARSRRAALLLVRRGGYAVGLSDGADLTAHKVGTKYVQGRTAAGGWSQQRFARRRAGQAAGLVGAAVEVANGMWSGHRQQRSPQVLVVGGDRRLVEEALSDPRLASVARLPRSPLLDVRDPRLDVLKDAVRRSRCVRVRLTEPDG